MTTIGSITPLRTKRLARALTVAAALALTAGTIGTPAAFANDNPDGHDSQMPHTCAPAPLCAHEVGSPNPQ